MSAQQVSHSFSLLKQYCEEEQFKGWDPYDGLNSRFFKALPFISRNRICRLAWIQFFKKSPVNFRRIFAVNKDYNTKGLALFLSGYCNLYEMQPEKKYLEKINFLGRKLIELQSKGYSGSCWGYNFDWQARAFFQPKYTPTVVATSYVANALFNAYDLTKENGFLQTALSATDFVLKDLQRTYDEKGHLSFSYSPLDKTQVFNASLLGVKLLSRAYAYNQNEIFKTESKKAVAFVCERQLENGAWPYGTLPFHQWVDSFHTGFNLECIQYYERYTGDLSFSSNFKKGMDYYLNNFFMEDGTPKYYNNKIYPVDIHAPAQLIVTLYKTGLLQQHSPLAEKVLKWTITHMQHKKGYFYYQKNKLFTSKIPYMRWSQAWMFYAMSCYLKEHGISL